MRAHLTLPVLLAIALAACDVTEFDGPDVVSRDRVLAGSAVAIDEPSRVTPEPGEQASYRLLVGGPGPQVSWTYLLAVCRFVRDENGAPSCDPELAPLGVSGSAEPSAVTPPELPSVDFSVPAAAALRADEHELLMQGIVCPGGAFDAALLSQLKAGNYSQVAAGRNPCADKSKNGVVLASLFNLARTPDATNHAPQIVSISSSKLTDKDRDVVQGAPWPTELAAAAPLEGCKGQGLLEVQQKDRIGIQLELDPAAREMYLDPSPIPGEKPRKRVEIPRVEGLASAGEFEIVRDNQLEAKQLLQLEWKLDDDAPADGLLVRFWFLAVDDRFGDTQATSWQARALCVLGR